MKNNRLLWVIIAMSVLSMGWGLWALHQPHPQSTEWLQEILLDHIQYMPEVYRAHESYAAQLHEDTCIMLIYRYSYTTCNICYIEDLSELRDLSKSIST